MFNLELSHLETIHEKTGHSKEDIAMIFKTYKNIVNNEVKRKQFNSADVIYKYLLEEKIQLTEQEVFSVICLDVKNRLIEKKEVFKGGKSDIKIDQSVLLKTILLSNAASVIFVHNHPSGDPKPSQSDLDTTRMLEEALELVGVRFLDHLVIGENGYVSIKYLEQELINELEMER